MLILLMYLDNAFLGATGDEMETTLVSLLVLCDRLGSITNMIFGYLYYLYLHGCKLYQ